MNIDDMTIGQFRELSQLFGTTANMRDDSQHRKKSFFDFKRRKYRLTGIPLSPVDLKNGRVLSMRPA